MKNESESFNDLIWKLTRKMKWYSFMIALALSVVFTSILLRKTHEVLCALVESQLEQISGPLARELILGETSIAKEVFQELQTELHALGTKENLDLVIFKKTPTGPPESHPHCSPQGLHAEVHFPIHLSGLHLGQIQGQVSHFSSLAFTIYILIIFLALAFTFRSLIRQILDKLQREIIQPIYKLSNNEELVFNSQTPYEVIQIQRGIEQLKATLVAKERYDLALQLAHDIRSPVAALEMISGVLHSDPEESLSVMRSALNRIKHIANHLLESNRLDLHSLPNASFQVLPISCLIEDLLAEIRIQFTQWPELKLDFTLKSDPYEIFGRIHAAQFKTVLSNLINNAAEALRHVGVILITLEKNQTHFIIEIIDQGPGIPAEILYLLGTRGVSYNKTQGNGLGIYHAKQNIQSWGGTLEIHSQTGEGTRLMISLPSSEHSALYSQSLSFSRKTQWICLDDDLSIHETWKLKAKTLGLENEPLCFSQIDAFLNDEALFIDENTFFFIDYYLRGQSHTGLDLLNKLPITNRSLLVTQDYDNSELQEQCRRLRVQILPKPLLRFFNPKLS